MILIVFTTFLLNEIDLVTLLNGRHYDTDYLYDRMTFIFLLVCETAKVARAESRIYGINFDCSKFRMTCDKNS